MEYFSLYGLFLAKVVTIVVAIVLLAVFVFGVGMRRQSAKGSLKLTDLGENYRERQRQMQQVKMNESEHKAWLKAFKKQQKAKSKSEKSGAKLGQTSIKKPCLYVLDFKGSMDAREVASLRRKSVQFWLLLIHKMKFCCVWRALAVWSMVMGLQHHNYVV